MQYKVRGLIQDCAEGERVFKFAKGTICRNAGLRQQFQSFDYLYAIPSQREQIVLNNVIKQLLGALFCNKEFQNSANFNI